MTDVTCCEKCCKPLDDHPLIDVSNVKVLQMCDRHPKWQRVEPGTVIPAGQPYRWEYDSGDAYETKASSGGRTVPDHPHHFIDSSWKPPLELPTEPTWGIAVIDYCNPSVGKWCMDRFWLDSQQNARFHRGNVLDFIPLTDEQVARIEAAR